MKGIKITYWIATIAFSLMMLFSAGMYIFANDFASEAFIALGYPTFLIYPLAAAKILGVVAILKLKRHPIKEWAYAGFFFTTILGTMSHVAVGDGQFLGVFVALLLVVISYSTGKKIKYV